MTTPNSPNPHEVERQITKAEVIDYVRSFTDVWDFDGNSGDANRQFATSISHWLLETFGQSNNAGEFFLSSDYDGFAGEDLPDELRHLVSYVYKDELSFQGGNRVSVRTMHVYEEEEPFLPEWQEIQEKFVAYKDMLGYVLSRPDIIARIEERRVNVLPQVAVTFSPYFSYGWGLHFLVSTNGISATPFGEAGKTRNATEFAYNNHDRGGRLARVVCQLTLLAALHNGSNWFSPPNGSARSLEARLLGESGIPLCLGNFRPNARNSILSLLISEVRSLRER